MYLSTTPLQTFMEFGEVHTVFVGRFKDQFKGIYNGKQNFRLTPFKPKHDISYKIKFGEEDRFFHVNWAEKNFSASETCSSGKTAPVYQEDGSTIDT